MAANSGPLGNGDGELMEVDSSQLITVDGGGKSLLINSNSVGAVHPANRQHPGVTKIFTLAKASDNSMHGMSSSAPTQIVVAPVRSSAMDNNAQTLTLSRSSLLNNAQTLTNVITMSPQKILTVPRTPPRQVISSKVSMSPGKSPGKITMIPVRSPQKILQPTQIVSMVSHSGINTGTQAFTNSKPITITSPNKVFVQRQTLGGSMPVSQLQPHTMQGSRFQYVRLVNAQAPSQPGQPTTVRQIVPAKSLLQHGPSSAGGQVRLQPAIQPMQKQIAKSIITSQNQRVILPATSQVRSMAPLAPRPSPQQTMAGASSVLTTSSLPPGATIIHGTGQTADNMTSFALVPAQYISQQHIQPVTARSALAPPHSVIPKTVVDSTSLQHRQVSSAPSIRMMVPQPNGPSSSSLDSSQRPRKPCNCTKSQCLKLYCDCFANGEFCHNCNCHNCFNNLEHEEDRGKAIKSCLDRNPLAFKPKIGKSRNGETADRRHNKGCNCKRSGCLKNYCECYEAKILCSNLCKCVGCKNFEESPDRSKSVNILSSSSSASTSASASDDSRRISVAGRSRASASSSHILTSRPAMVTTGERLPYSFVTDDVALATCMCLVAQAEEAERTRQTDTEQERMIIEEFGRCLMQVIDSAKNTKPGDVDSNHSS